MYKITEFFVLYHSLLYPLVLFTQSNFSVMGPFYSVDVSNLIARSKPDCVYTAICVVLRISRIVPLVSQINCEVHSSLMWSDYSSKPGGKTEILQEVCSWKGTSTDVFRNCFAVLKEINFSAWNSSHRSFHHDKNHYTINFWEVSKVHSFPSIHSYLIPSRNACL